MKTIKEILENYSEYEVFLDDRFGSRLCQFLTDEEMNKIGFTFENKNGEPREIKQWTKENVLAQLKEDVEFGFEKALSQRGISASLMFNVVMSWNKVLEDGLETYSKDDYAMYGLPLFKATAVKYGWENPIGEDTGRETYYNED